MRSNSAILLVTCAIALAAPAAGGESNKPGEGPNIPVVQLMGTWKGMQCESTQGSTVSRRRQFVMTETTWKIIVHVFGDAKCSPETLLFTVDFGGDYELGANSNTVTGAQETRFSFVCYVREVHRVALQQGAEPGCHESAAAVPPHHAAPRLNS
jgi:hypothetical protein